MRRTVRLLVYAEDTYCGSLSRVNEQQCIAARRCLHGCFASALNRGWCSPHTSTKLNWHCTCTGGGCAAGAVPLWPVLDGGGGMARCGLRRPPFGNRDCSRARTSRPVPCGRAALPPTKRHASCSTLQDCSSASDWHGGTDASRSWRLAPPCRRALPLAAWCRWHTASARCSPDRLRHDPFTSGN